MIIKCVHAQLKCAATFIMLINVKMPTIIIVGIITFISMINTISKSKSCFFNIIVLLNN